jgi:hypothetical protein
MTLRSLLLGGALLALSSGLVPAAHAARSVSLNAATAVQLAALEGVDAATAERVVALRDQRGNIGSVEALRILNLPESALDALRDGTHVDLAIKRAGGKKYGSVDEVLAEFSGEPDIRAVQAMAQEYSMTRPDLVQNWLKASKRAFLLPSMSLTYRKELDLAERDEWADADSNTKAWQDEWERREDTVTGENDDTYQVSLRWRLDKLVMSSEQIRVISESQDVVKLRDKVLDEVTRLYFDRRRLQVDLLLNPVGDLKKQLEDELRLQEMTANLDALTGGTYSASLPKN